MRSIRDDEDAAFGVRRTGREMNWHYQYDALSQTEDAHQHPLESSLQVHYCAYMENTIFDCVFLSKEWDIIIHC